MKKITRIAMLIFAVTILISTASAYADVVQPIKEMQIGDYFILGKYNEEPIAWRYVADDENGKLIVSDKIVPKFLLTRKDFYMKVIFQKKKEKYLNR